MLRAFFGTKDLREIRAADLLDFIGVKLEDEYAPATNAQGGIERTGG